MSRTQQVMTCLALVAAMILTACGDNATATDNTANPVAVSSTDTCTLSDDVRAVAVVLPVHQGGAAGMPEQFRCTIREAIERGLPIRVVTAEGTPTLAIKVRVQPDPVNPVAFEDDVVNAEASLIAQVRNLTATSDGNDTWGALLLAEDELTSIGAGGRNSLILSRDNGHSDSGLLRMTDPDMTNADPKEVAAFVSKNGGCGALKGATVDLYGLGETVAPHPAVTARQRAAIANQYQATLTACGATATTQPLPATGAGPVTDRVTRPVAPDNPVVFSVEERTSVDLRQDTLAYAADQAAFVDPDRARAVLVELAQQLKANPGIRVEIRGRTAAGPTAWPSLPALGKARAELCAKVLRDAGVTPSQIRTHGDGYLAQPPITGPASAAANRVTRFIFRA